MQISLANSVLPRSGGSRAVLSGRRQGARDTDGRDGRHQGARVSPRSEAVSPPSRRRRFADAQRSQVSAPRSQHRSSRSGRNARSRPRRRRPRRHGASRYHALRLGLLPRPSARTLRASLSPRRFADPRIPTTGSRASSRAGEVDVGAAWLDNVDPTSALSNDAGAVPPPALDVRQPPLLEMRDVTLEAVAKHPMSSTTKTTRRKALYPSGSALA